MKQNRFDREFEAKWNFSLGILLLVGMVISYFSNFIAQLIFAIVIGLLMSNYYTFRKKKKVV